MAGQITHILAGEEALRRAAPEAAEDALGSAGPYFRLGCQGPDLFYHNQRTKPSGLHYGSLAHRGSYGLVVGGALAALAPPRRRAGAPAGAYLLGMATHAAVDRATHPFIVCFSGWPSPSDPASERYRSCHPFLERVLDAALLASLRGIAPGDYDLEAAFAPSGSRALPGEAGGAVDGEIVALWAAGLRAAYPRSSGGDFLLERRVGNALADARYFYAITNPAVTALNREREDWFAYLDDRVGYRSVALVYPESPPADMDPMNLSHERWPHPADDGRSSEASYLELVEEGIEAAAAALRVLLAVFGGNPVGAFGPGSIAAVAEAVGTGCLSIADRAGLVTTPRVARPLPLAELMAEEYRKRLAWAKRLSSSV